MCFKYLIKVWPGLILILITTISRPAGVNGANILVLAPLATHSHAIWFDIVTSLLAKQHQVIVLSSDPERKWIANRTTYELETSYVGNAYDYDLGNITETWGGGMGAAANYKMINDWNIDLCKIQARSEGLKRFLKEVVQTEVKIDLIIKDGAGSECYIALLHLFNYPPVISATPFPKVSYVNDWIGDYDNPSYVPLSLVSYTDHMTFVQRFHNTYLTLYTQFIRHFDYLPTIDKLSKEIFGPLVPHVKDLEYKVELAFVNYHPVLDYPKPIVPACIPVPGLQLKPPQKLPQAIQTFLYDAQHGAIIFTFGSSLHTTNMSPAYRTMFFNVFSKLKQRVIWKWEDIEPPADKPDNIMLAKWLPQADILAHNNTLAFISHCGQAGVQEAIYSAVPVLGIPFMIDQYISAAKIQSKGVGIQMAYDKLTEESLFQALETLTDPKHGYKQRMSDLSAIFRDMPETSSDKIVFWTNYILKHHRRGEPSHLIPASVHLNVFQYYLLDVIGLLMATPLVLFYVTKIMLRMWRR